YLMPPPSSGGVVVATALKLFEKTEITRHEPLSFNEQHLMAEILKHSFRGRTLLGDPDFHKNPVEKLLSEEYLNSLAKNIKLSKSSVLKELDQKFIDDSKETTHFNVM